MCARAKGRSRRGTWQASGKTGGGESRKKIGWEGNEGGEGSRRRGWRERFGGLLLTEVVLSMHNLTSSSPRPSKLADGRLQEVPQPHSGHRVTKEPGWTPFLLPSLSPTLNTFK